jgi:AraC-like DNA-binding protein
MLHELNIFLLSFGALQGVLLSLILFRNRRKHSSGLYLTLLLSLAGLQLTLKLISKTWLMSHVTTLYQVSYIFPFLAGPFLYFFVRSRVTDASFRVRDFLHFLPFGLVTCYVLFVSIYGYVYTTPVDRAVMMTYPKAGFQLLSLAAYSWASLRVAGLHSSEAVRIAMRQFIAVVAACEGMIIIAIALLHANYGAFPDIRLAFAILTLMIYWISYKVISQPDVFRPAGGVLIPLKMENQSKYAHSGLKAEDAERIAALLRDAMQQRKLYLDADLSIDSLAAELKINRHHLSQVLNEKFQQSYFDFINGYRLEEAGARLTSAKFKHYTIAAIAHDSGFSSVSNFNDVFKRRFGVTPSRFRLQHAGRMSA